MTVPEYLITTTNNDADLFARNMVRITVTNAVTGRTQTGLVPTDLYAEGNPHEIVDALICETRGVMNARNNVDRVIDDIDALVDAQLEQTPTGYDYNVNQDRCPHCTREWHGLAITERIAAMRRRGEFDETYRYDQDDTPVLCPGSNHDGAWTPPERVRPTQPVNDEYPQPVGEGWTIDALERLRHLGRWPNPIMPPASAFEGDRVVPALEARGYPIGEPMPPGHPAFTLAITNPHRPAREVAPASAAMDADARQLLREQPRWWRLAGVTPEYLHVTIHHDHPLRFARMGAPAWFTSGAEPSDTAVAHTTHLAYRADVVNLADNTVEDCVWLVVDNNGNYSQIDPTADSVRLHCVRPPRYTGRWVDDATGQPAPSPAAPQWPRDIPDPLTNIYNTIRRMTEQVLNSYHAAEEREAREALRAAGFPTPHTATTNQVTQLMDIDPEFRNRLVHEFARRRIGEMPHLEWERGGIRITNRIDADEQRRARAAIVNMSNTLRRITGTNFI